jgi:urate oxidase
VAAGDIVLGPNQYGKAECRLVKVTRDTDRHVVEDLNVTSQLRGDFEACHLEGDNSHVVATDTQKNTVYAFARDGIGSPEEFLLRLGRHFVGEFPWVSGGRWAAEQYVWERILVDGEGHDHAFSRTGRETRTAVVEIDGASGDLGVTVTAGLQDCTVLKSTGSEFHGFPRDRYTTLEETSDRILATSVTATWRYRSADIDYNRFEFNTAYAGIRDLLLATFADVHSLALQQTIFAMGKAVLEQYDEVAQISLSCPNKHHFLVDLEPFGLDNPGEVFFAADRPYGLIEATVQREGA